MKKVLFLSRWLTAALVFLCLLMTGPARAQVTIVCDPSAGAPVMYGLDQLTAALTAKNISFNKVNSLNEAKTEPILVAGGEAAAQLLKSSSHTLPDSAEALTIWKTQYKNKSVWVAAGHDDRGLMYALLDIADRLPFGSLTATTESPYIAERAVSIYTMNRNYWETRLYDENYWTRYLDMLAHDRFNSLVIIFGYENGGFLAPCYPYFFNVDGFPDVRMVGLSAEQQQRNLKAFNRLIEMAHARGIRLTAAIWDHIYRGGVQGGGIPGAKDVSDAPVPGLVWGLNGDNLTTYTKAALTKFVKEMPNLDAIEFRMHDESGLKNGEQETFWRDIFQMMKATAPDLHLVLRAKELKESIIQNALDAGIHFKIETKFWMEQMGLPYHPTMINPEKSPRRHSYSDLLRYPQRYKIHWRLWNGGTSRILLWGSPDYARRFAESARLYSGDSYEVNEPLATKMEAQPHDAAPFALLNPAYRYYDYEFERYWHFFQVFGRVGYNPKTPDAVWDREFTRRLGDAGPLLEQALHKASWILPRIISSCYPYSYFPTTRGWAEKQRLGDLPSYAKGEVTDLMQFANADEEAQFLIDHKPTPKLLPSANSQWLAKVSSDVLSLVDDAQKRMGDNPSKEFVSTITDLKILSYLALYHSRRINAAVSYRLFERTQDAKALDDAIAGEKKAIEAWREIVKAAGDVYTDDLMMGVRVADLCGHWRDELSALEKGLTTLEATRRDPSPTAKAPKFNPAAISDYHTLFQISHKPVSAHAVGQPIKIRLKITSKAPIQWIHLRYRSVNQEEEYKTLTMTRTKELNVYEATVPADQVNPKYDFMYLFEIMDKSNRGAIFPNVSKETPYYITQLIR
ncbi:MAG: hypothetical protein JST68_09025 [Bacteroidetes bacterium]|nr:hypothetical protein [Bacteroidota bacterium]